MYHYLIKYKGQVIVLIMLIVVVSASSVVALTLNMQQLNAIIALNRDEFIYWFVIDIVLYLIYAVCDYLKTIYQEKLIQRMMMDIRADITVRLQRASYEQVMKRDINDYLSWLTSDMEQITIAGYNIFFGVVQLVMMLVMSVGVLLTLHWTLSVLTLIFALILLKLPTLLDKPTQKATEQLSQAQEQFVSNAQNLLQGYGIFYTFNQLSQLTTQIRKQTQQLMTQKVAYQRNFAFVQLVVWLLNLMCQMGIFITTALLVFYMHATAGMVMAVGTLSGTVFNSLGQIVQYTFKLKAIQIYFDKYQTIQENSYLMAPHSRLHQSLEVRNLSLKVNDRVILHPLSFKIEKGKKYALIGESGSGKTTLLQILSGRIQHYEGEMLLDGIKLSKEESVILRDSVIYHAQKNHLFNDTIKNNIYLWQEGDKQLLPELALADFCQLDDFISENSAKLSGGQRQRIALARTLLETDKILLLDESTASLDSDNAKRIEGAILRHPDLTVILVTHRLFEEHIPYFDEIIRMNNKPVL